ncbi:unnamed protein product [Pedinophyceae sp. YPF-701]|nr:unnamed protein product [Pedinophyceae sp. YPF-701]
MAHFCPFRAPAARPPGAVCGAGASSPPCSLLRSRSAQPGLRRAAHPSRAPLRASPCLVARAASGDAGAGEPDVEKLRYEEEATRIEAEIELLKTEQQDTVKQARKLISTAGRLLDHCQELEQDAVRKLKVRARTSLLSIVLPHSPHHVRDITALRGGSTRGAVQRRSGVTGALALRTPGRGPLILHAYARAGGGRGGGAGGAETEGSGAQQGPPEPGAGRGVQRAHQGPRKRDQQDGDGARGAHDQASQTRSQARRGRPPFTASLYARRRRAKGRPP